MKKKILLLTGISTIALGVAGALLAVKGGDRTLHLDSVDDYFTLTINGGDLTKETDMDLANGSTALVTDSTKEAIPANQNTVTFGFVYAPYGKSGDYDYTYLTQNAGKIWNEKGSPIRSMKRIDLVGYGNVVVSWGWLNELDEIEYYASESINIGGDGDYSIFNGYTPNYVKISAPNYAAPGIKQIKISYDKSCTLAENPYFNDGGLKFRKRGADEAEVLGFSGSVINPLVIPSEVKGLTVTKIADNAFGDKYGLTSVTIPNTITHIGEEAFYSSDDLATITFQPGGSEELYIGDQAFGGVTSLTGTFTIPKRAANNLSQYSLDDMYYVSAFVFEDNYADGDYYCVDGVLYQGDDYYGTKLHTYPMGKTTSTFTVPADVTRFNPYVGIQDNDYIETLIFENTGALVIEEYCISLCDNLSSVQFNGSGAVTIGWYAFSGDESLSELVLPANTILGRRALGGLGATEEHPLSVFFEGNDISSWYVSDDYYGSWYTEKGDLCKLYLKSDTEIAEGDLPDHVDGSWHYVSDIPTPYHVKVMFVCSRTDIGSGYAFYLMNSLMEQDGVWIASEANRGNFNNSKGRWEVVLSLVPGTNLTFKGAISTWDSPTSITYEVDPDRSWTPDRLSQFYNVNWQY